MTLRVLGPLRSHWFWNWLGNWFGNWFWNWPQNGENGPELLVVVAALAAPAPVRIKAAIAGPASAAVISAFAPNRIEFLSGKSRRSRTGDCDPCGHVPSG